MDNFPIAGGWLNTLSSMFSHVSFMLRVLLFVVLSMIEIDEIKIGDFREYFFHTRFSITH